MRFFERYHPAALLAYFAAVLLIAMFTGSPLTVALALQRKDEMNRHFKRLEEIWDAYSVYVNKENQ